MSYEYDIFYSDNNLDFKQKKEILNKAKKICYEWRVDVIKKWTREREEMPFSKIMKMFKNDSFFRIIHRRGYNNPEYLEIVFTEGNYFLWLFLDLHHLDYFVKKYNLKILGKLNENNGN